MNEDSKNFRIIKDKPRSKKLKPKIDLAAMVSVSFLLIIFFMLTSYLSRPQAMDFGRGDICCGPDFGCYKPDQNRVLTLLLDDDNKVIFYWGLLEVPNEKPKVLDYGKNGLRKELAAKNKIIKEYMNSRGRNNDGPIVIIKPGKKSNYGNLVDILDEMAINNIQAYSIVNDYTPQELKLLASK